MQEFKGLYELYQEKNTLNLLYSANYCETVVDCNQINKFFKFCKETKTFTEDKNSFSKDCLLFIV
jgi:hypothetical protein